MAHKKISREAANTIARRIVNKAFEHLIDPIDKRLEEIGEEASEILHSRIDLETLRKYNLIGAESTEMQIKLFIDHRRDDAYSALVTGPGWSCSYWDCPCLEHAELATEAQALQDRRMELSNKASSLRRELHNQCYGKSTKAAIAAWPEAASIISSITNEPITAGFVTPLESLLARFLPMLPAPTPSEA